MRSIQDRRAEAILLQQRVMDTAAPLYVQACPGAGKTTAIVNRHLNRPPVTGRKGRALFSFTNAACNEINRRCHDASRPDAVTFPHFIGTIDTFIWRYLTRPLIADNRYRRRIDSWDRINATVTVPGAKRPHTLRLSDFQFHRDLTSRICTARYQLSRRNYTTFKALENEGLLAHAGTLAVQSRDTYAAQGYLTGHEIRIRALHSLVTRGPAIMAMLRPRFEEIVIDEAQDCSNLDLAILKHLHHGDLPLVFVCDPDQAIYAFRGAEPDSVREFGAALPATIELTGNWRSSPAICRLAATLRPTRHARPADVPIGPHHDEQSGILLIAATSGEHTMTSFAEQAQRLNIPEDNRLILAHAGNTLPKQAKGTSSPPTEAAPRLAWAAAVLADPLHTTRQRESAYEIAERALLRYWYGDTDGHTVEALCERHELERAQFRRHAARFGCALPSVDHGTFSAWCTTANATLKQHPPQAGLTRQGRSGSLRAATGAKNSSPRTAAKAPVATAPSAARAAVVHQVKGEEEDAVLVILPDDERVSRLIDAWISGTHDPDLAENLRVLYVASTRARRLLAFEVPEAVYDKLRAHLDSEGVPMIGEEGGREHRWSEGVRN